MESFPHSETIASVLKQAVDTLVFVVLVGLQAEDRHNLKLFEQVDERSIY